MIGEIAGLAFPPFAVVDLTRGRAFALGVRNQPEFMAYPEASHTGALHV